LLSIRFLPPEYRQRIVALRNRVEVLYLSCIQEWRQISPEALLDMDDQLLLRVLLSSVNAVPHWWKGDRDPQTTAKQVIAVLMNSIQKHQ
jgi:hypothetical protein